VGVKNTGKGAAAEPTALLKNLGGAEVFIDVGRQRLDALAPGATGLARFSFKVTAPPDQPAPGKVQLRLQVFDGVMGDYLVEKLALPIKAPAPSTTKRSRAFVEASAAIPVLAAAEPQARVLGRLDAGARVESVGEANGFVRLDLGGGNLYGYVAQSAVGPARGKASTTPQGSPQGFSMVYGRDPPTIRFVDAAGAALGEVVTTDAASLELVAQIADDGAVADAYVFVGDQKVHYQRVASAGPTAATLRHSLTLKPGVNVVTVVAREDDEFAQREVLTVYSTRGDPFADKKVVRH
jgi:hypothetical protein